MANDQNEVGISASDHNMCYNGLFMLLGKDILSNVVLTLQEEREHDYVCGLFLEGPYINFNGYNGALILY